MKERRWNPSRIHNSKRWFIPLSGGTRIHTMVGIWIGQPITLEGNLAISRDAEDVHGPQSSNSSSG